MVDGASRTCPAQNDISTIVKTLKTKNITPDILFRVSNIKSIENRAKFECLKPWLNQMVKDDPFLHGSISAELTKQISDLLDISWVACYEASCSAPVLKIRSSFQDMMYDVARGSHNILKETIRIIQAHRFANRFPNRAAWVIDLHVERKCVEKIYNEIGKLRKLADDISADADQVVKLIQKSTSETRNRLDGIRNRFQNLEMKKIEFAQRIKDMEGEKTRAVKLLEDLEENLDVKKKAEKKLAKKKADHEKCKKRRNKELEKNKRKYDSEKEKLEEEKAKKRNKCHQLQRNIYSDDDDEDDTDECSHYNGCIKAGRRNDIDKYKGQYDGPCCKIPFKYQEKLNWKCTKTTEGSNTNSTEEIETESFFCKTEGGKGEWGNCISDYSCSFGDRKDNSGDACIAKCISDKKFQESINAVTIQRNGEKICQCEMNLLTRSSSAKTCFLVPVGVPEYECKERRAKIREERQKKERNRKRAIYEACNAELRLLEAKKITMKTPEACEAWTEEGRLFSMSMDISLLEVKINAQKELIKVTKERITRFLKKSHTITVPDKSNEEEVEKSIQNLRAAEKSILLAKKSLCSMKKIFRMLKMEPSGSVSSDKLRNKGTKEVKILVLRSGLHWLAYAMGVNDARKQIQRIKKIVTDSLISFPLSKMEGERVMQNAERIMADSQRFMSEIHARHHLGCSR